MEFLNPYFLFALATLAVPVLIHLFNLRRYKKEYFTNVQFLSQIQLETRKRSNLKQLLILASRLLILLCLVFAFAQPFIPPPLNQVQKPGHQLVTVYLDNSYSMEANGKEGRLFDMAKKRAAEILASYKSSDVFRLLTNDADGRFNQFVSKDEFLSELREVRISHLSSSLNDLSGRISDLPSKQKNSSQTCFIISDFQKSTVSFENLRTDSLVRFILVPVQGKSSPNLFVDSVWFDSPTHRKGQIVKLIARIRNSGNENLEKIPLRLIINNRQKAVSSFNAEAGKFADVSLPYMEDNSGFQYGKLEISDYPVVYDDKFYFSYPISESIHVLNFYDRVPDPYLTKLFSTDSIFNFRSAGLTLGGAGQMNQQNLIILSGITELSSGLALDLRSFAEHGGSVVIFPSESSDNQSVNDFLEMTGSPSFGALVNVSQRVSSLDLENPLFKEVIEKDSRGKTSLPENADLPAVYKYFQPIPANPNTSITLMRLQNGAPFLSVTPLGKGKVYSFYSPAAPAFTNFQQHLLFLPVLFRIAFLSEAVPELYYTLGTNSTISLPADSVSDKTMIKVKMFQGRYEFIPEIRSSGRNIEAIAGVQVNEAGWYEIEKARHLLSVASYNYDRRESDLNCLSLSDIESEISKFHLRNFNLIKSSQLPLTKQIQELNNGIQLWKAFLILALIFLAIEIALIRLLKP